MFGLCVIITISVVGMIWFRSFEENLFVLLNPEPDKQQQFYAERAKRTPTVYANITESLGKMRASLYDAMGFLKDYNSGQVKTDGDIKGETHKLPLSGDK